MSSAAPPPLCLHCGKVPLTYDDLRSVISSEGAIPFFLLGSWSHISTSPCPLCQLVAHAIFEAHRLSPGSFPQGDDETFALVWKDDAEPGHRGAYSINDSTNTATGQFVCFVSESPETTQVASGAHFLLPTIKSKVEISRILQWIETCTTTHPITRCRAHNYQGFKSTFPRLQVLRLIDLDSDSLIEVSDIRPYKYVALSYVWGGVSSFRLTKSTLGRLRQPGSVSQIRDRLSLTILDTMKLVKLLGLRYVWVDLLCLVQDDPEDLRRGTAVMDNVFERSWLTVIAACGNHANYGLPAVTGTRAPQHAMRITDKTRLGLYTPLDWALAATVYQTRGWTFQEQALCQRALCFVDNKVFFRCGSDGFSEACLDQPVAKKRHEWEEPWSPPQAFRLKDPVRDWEDIVSRYSGRALTDQRDVLRAVEGIMRRAREKGNIRFIEGTPVQAIDFFLLFGAGFTSMTARRRREGFPSWSWSGWVGSSRVRPSQGHVFYQLHHWLKQKCWILWYERGVDGELRLITDPVRNSPSGPRYRERFTSQLPSGSDAFRTAPSLSPTVTPGYSVLQFWTLAIFLEFSRSISWSKGDLRGADGQICGELTVDSIEEMPSFEHAGPYEILLLSEAVSTPHPQTRQSEYDYNVILVKRDGDFAERRGIGHIREWAIGTSFAPGPIWKEIMLK
ncbi:hypothetical protein CGCSCA4_v009552 [Colletotrichum siamense]|uniref:Heterokaryon incompatibility domain-containing protein n=1 Tax=Colletotrichum siamense TaxID=690259 RepID=A0A9P5K317_COLSI|nr:hypothetical protein CGCSCA4_v009552 [Colletotrichum siamense]KAF4854800.1 hypothetical protein CGCSCA2_v009426 [Colletotrichum siamense]